MSNDQTSLSIPSEDAPHERTFMQWPVSRRVHSDRWFLQHLQETIADVANAIAEFEPVVMLAAKEHHAKARRLLSQTIALWDIPTEDLWCRDSGPLFAKTTKGELVVSHIQFNGWGNRQVHRHDGLVARRIAKRLGVSIIDSGLTGEGGGVESDGHGLLMAHESSWVNANRNPGMSREETERRLLQAYGARTMIWSPGLSGHDITDYHIDSLARFTGSGRVFINLPERQDQRDPFHSAALETFSRLRSAGLEIDIVAEPNKRRVRSDDFVASYANYYVCNGAVIMAEFGDRRTDRLAQDAVKRHYPGREIVTLNVDALGEIGGGIHCATQQQPAI
ncbi:MAG: agmatine deiminase family protein [Ahrensia sp.]|nr:agmatine deiminase family protein [Ahrensia sp.]